MQLSRVDFPAPLALRMDRACPLSAELYLQYLTEEVRVIRDAQGLRQGPLQREDKKAPVDSPAPMG